MQTGGHSIDCPEPVFGLAVTGKVKKEHIKQNNQAKPGSLLYLTKPLGIGIITTAQKKGIVEEKHLKAAMDTMLTLNSFGAQLGKLPYVSALTDVTGFGILGHLVEMAHGCDARVVMNYSSLPFYPAALEMYKKGETTGSNKANRKMVARHKLELKASLSTHEEELLYDPQTSGGLLLALPSSQANELVRSLSGTDVPIAVKIGEITADPIGITVES